MLGSSIITSAFFVSSGNPAIVLDPESKTLGGVGADTGFNIWSDTEGNILASNSLGDVFISRAIAIKELSVAGIPMLFS